MKGLKTAHASLHHWYQQYGRHHLPWRHTTDPYRIYVSEVMLQQTQVNTVLERYYNPFTTRFPSLTSLAQASEKEVLKAWEGLGYYRRAKNLHKTAQITAPSLPTSLEELLTLPGIGNNTAHAILAFAYKKPVPIMEANVKRILCRLLALTTPSDKILWQHAYACLDTSKSFDYNQALMDLGTQICTAKNPSCISCPLTQICQGKQQPLLYPTPSAKVTCPIRHKNIFVIRTGNRYYLTQRQENFLSGLYGFVEHPQDQPINFLNQEILLADCKPLGSITQSYSHFTLKANLWYSQYNQKVETMTDWFTLEQIHNLPLSRADQKILTLLTT